METVLEFLENEKESVLEKIKEYAESGNTYSIGTSNEKLKYLNILIQKAQSEIASNIDEKDLPY